MGHDADWTAHVEANSEFARHASALMGPALAVSEGELRSEPEPERWEPPPPLSITGV